MRQLLLTIVLLSGLQLSGQGQLSDRIYFGGGLGLAGGSNSTNISLFPQVGYRLTDRWVAGVGISYQYVRFRQQDLSINNYGWSVFTMHGIFRRIFGYAEFEQLNFEYFVSINPEITERNNYNSFLLGLGFAESLGGRAAFNVMALYNVLYDSAESPQPYGSPWVIRAGIGVGFL